MATSLIFWPNAYANNDEVAMILLLPSSPILYLVVVFFFFFFFWLFVPFLEELEGEAVLAVAFVAYNLDGRDLPRSLLLLLPLNRKNDFFRLGRPSNQERAAPSRPLRNREEKRKRKKTL